MPPRFKMAFTGTQQTSLVQSWEIRRACHSPLVITSEKTVYRIMLTRFAIFFLLADTCLAQDTARMEQIVQSYLANQQFMGSVLVARGS
jgi:hypothetical protein